MNHKLSHIRQLIQSAQQEDSGSARLARLLALRTDHLHEAIKLPATAAETLLAEFVLHYIAQVPEFIEVISEMTQEAGIYERILPLLNIASEYFLTPPDIIGQHSQLEALLDEAYLAHRLLEEINDRFIGCCGVPLAPMDMTRVNVIMHELIGEPYANELDQAVLFSAELLLNQYDFGSADFQKYTELHLARDWSAELQRWSCLTKDVTIVLDFGQRQGSKSSHH
jgi:hypothetical protein